MMHHVAVFRVIDLIMYGLSLCIKGMTPPDMTRYLTDAVYNLTEQQLKEGARYEVFC